MDCAALDQAISGAAVVRDYAGGATRVIDPDQVRTLAETFGVSPRALELAALDREVIPARYARNMSSISAAGQKRLLESTVVQVGLGGLGGHMLDIMARSGVGRIRVFDGDGFEASNLNRQLLSSEARLGAFKAEAALDHARSVNSSVEIEAWPEYANAKALEKALQGGGLLVDCLGALSAREMLAKAQNAAGAPLVTAGVAGWTAWVSTVFPGEPGPAELMLAVSGSSPDAQDALGCPAPAVVALAGIQAAEVLRLLAGEEPALRGKMLIFDLESMTFEIMQM
jgi:molybdopterin/thiamine biosynthesis adenylyltransferase